MHAVVNHLHLTKPVDEFRNAIQQELLPIFTAQPGFHEFHFVKVAEDRAIVIILWQDAESADNGGKVIGPTWFAQNFAPYLASEQERSTGEVIVHTGG
jgi:hypothetical protein